MLRLAQPLVTRGLDAWDVHAGAHKADACGTCLAGAALDIASAATTLCPRASGWCTGSAWLRSSRATHCCGTRPGAGSWAPRVQEACKSSVCFLHGAAVQAQEHPSAACILTCSL
eukprot:4498502-Alexandrium_andersonii.AAC.1